MAGSPLTIHSLHEADLEEAAAVLDAAFERTGMGAGLRLTYALQPQGWLCARRDGRIVAVVGAYDYGPAASVGMMGVHPAGQRAGLGEQIMRALLARLDARHCPLVFLDASAAGQHLYPRLGFVPAGDTLRMRRAALPPQPAAPPPDPGDGLLVGQLRDRDLEEVVAFDTPLFGMNRAVVLGAFHALNPERALIAQDAGGRVAGYALGNAAHIGPWTAASPLAAERLLAAALALPYDVPPFLTCPAQNSHAVELLRRNGFTVTERLLHMLRGSPADPRRVAHIYAQASLTVG